MSGLLSYNVVNMEKAEIILERADQMRRECNFGDAINLYREAADAQDVSEEIRRRALASIDLIQEINGFVNVDLLNP